MRTFLKNHGGFLLLIAVYLFVSTVAYTKTKDVDKATFFGVTAMCIYVFIYLKWWARKKK